MPAISKIIAPLAIAASIASAAPTSQKRDALVSNYGDANILQYALTLEHLERAFYRDALNRFSADDFRAAGQPDWVRQRFTEIAGHEKTHVDFLTAGLTAAGAVPVQECSYVFGSVINSVATFIAYSQILEGVGVAAYLGAAPSIQSKDYLGYAGDILVVETQHSTWANSAIDHQAGFPRAFAAGLDFNQVYSLAAPLITACPANNTPLPFYTFPALTVTNPQPIYYDGYNTINYKFDQSIVDTANKKGQTLYAAFVAATGTEYVKISSNSGSITPPATIRGQSYLLILNGPYLCDAATVAGPALVNFDIQATNMPY